MVWISLSIVLLLCGALLVLLAAILLAWGLTHPPRMGDGKALAVLHRLSPGDLSLRFTDVAFDVIDEANPPNKIHIAGWWMPAEAPSDRCVLLIHGYADAKIGAIAWAPIFHALGWNTFAIDLRAHGESGGSAVTGGHFERHDVSQVVDFLRDRFPAGTQQLILFGVSMGSAIATHVAAMRTDIAGVICESFVGNFIFASHAQLHLMGLPGGIIGRLSAHIAAWMTGADFRNDTALHALPKVSCPVMLILGTEDPFADQMAITRVSRQLPNVQLWRPEGIHHVGALAAGYDEYASHITAFLLLVEIAE